MFRRNPGGRGIGYQRLRHPQFSRRQSLGYLSFSLSLSIGLLNLGIDSPLLCSKSSSEFDAEIVT